MFLPIPAFPPSMTLYHDHTKGMMGMVHAQQESTRHTSLAMEDTASGSTASSDVIVVEDAPETQQAAARQARKQAYLALTGSALLQLPIWGM